MTTTFIRQPTAIGAHVHIAGVPDVSTDEGGRLYLRCDGAYVVIGATPEELAEFAQLVALAVEAIQ